MTALRSARRLIRDEEGYESAFRAALRDATGTGDVVWDVGANVGIYTRLLSEWVGPSGQVVAIEPAPACFDTLRRNLADCTNVRLFQVALGASAAVLPMLLADDPEAPTHSLASATGANGNTIDVAVLSGDELREREKLPVPQLIKIDVEGFEPEALRGLATTLDNASCRAVFCEVHFGLLAARGQKQAPRAIEQHLRDSGFRTRWIDPSHLGAYRPQH